MDVTIRAFQPSDVALPSDAQIVAHGVTLERAGRVIATGGIVRVGAHWWTFSEIQPEGRRGMITHRLVVNALRAAETVGITPIFGYCDETKPLARKWIEAIGFRLARENEKDADIIAVERWCNGPAWIRAVDNGD